MSRKGQNISEYAIVLSLVMLSLYAMNAYFKRNIQAVVKSSSDELGRCAEAEYRAQRGQSTNYKLLGEAEMGLVNVISRPPQTMEDNIDIETGEHNDQTTKDVTQRTTMAASQSGEYVSFDGFSFYENTLLDQGGSGQRTQSQTTSNSGGTRQ